MDVPGKCLSPPVVVTADLDLLDHILSVAAAVGVEPQVVADAGAVRPVWSAASLVVVGADQAPVVSNLVLPRRPGVLVVGEEGASDEVCSWSAPLGAAVVLLPSGAGRLTSAMVDAVDAGADRGRVLTVVGGSGGAGASTCAMALAFAGAQRGLRTLLVDADPLGGGIDLLASAERVPGWRWPRLGTARGHLGNLTGHLPQVEGVDILSMARGPLQPGGSPNADQMQAVLMSATRTHELVVVDVPRQLTAAAREALRRADLALLMVVAQLRPIAAAQQVADELDQACTGLSLAVRTTRPRGLSADVVADTLGLQLLTTIGDEPALGLGAARGELPGRWVRSPYGKSCAKVLDVLTAGGSVR